MYVYNAKEQQIDERKTAHLGLGLYIVKSTG